MKKKLLLITILFVGLTIKAQQIKIRPSISYAATYSAFQHSTIPEPYFSTTFSANSFLGLNIEWHMTNKYAAYLKIANHGVSNSIKDVNQIKPNLFDVFWGDNTIESGQFATIFGVGIQSDITSKRQRNKLYVNFGINVAIQPPLDFRSGIGGPYLGSNVGLVRNFTFKSLRQKNVYPVFELGLSHPLFNKHNKEILQITFLASHAFQKVFESVLDFEYAGPRYGGTQRQQAIFASRAFSLQLVISKGIGILNRKK